ncbi:LytR family transcriptional regulator [Curtobacterium sp. MCBD17_019]|nr:LytR family transcriptional regulator [Curtobacterium sp. MCBD17_019]
MRPPNGVHLVSDAPLRRRRGRPGIARHGRLRRPSSWRTLLTVIASVLSVALVSSVAVTAFAAVTLTGSVSTVKLSDDDQASANKTSITAMKGGANILLIGSDTRVGQKAESLDTEGARNDVTILIHISADHTQLTAVSFPRDLVVPLPACTNPDTGTSYPASSAAQINTALGNGGVSCVVDTVENLTGLSIPYAGLITFDGVIEMSNAVGGVSVCVANSINDSYTGLHLSAGTHTLQGTQALQFLRTRHGVGDGSDLARISSQQVFLSALLRKVTSNGTLSNPLTLYKLARAAISNMTLSDGLASAQTLVSLATTLKSMSTADMLFVQYPVTDDPYDTNRVIVSQSDAHTLNVALQNDTKTSLTDSSTGRASEAEGGTGSASSSGTGSSGSSSSGTSSSGTSSAPSSGSSASSSASSTPSATATPLPSTITGQSAAEQTCSVGN